MMPSPMSDRWNGTTEPRRCAENESGLRGVQGFRWRRAGPGRLGVVQQEREAAGAADLRARRRREALAADEDEHKAMVCRARRSGLLLLLLDG